eukprot:TRINITY_DN970_c0_g1_i1.p1 TRINITY_DN970_c0_g1~~TRINITY_DN970_c0_g1_i1.p1  ORF type:complete len:682 (+),score=174.39 TRINITY_DN970_c0_g1_i1:239-2284(+)
MKGFLKKVASKVKSKSKKGNRKTVAGDGSEVNNNDVMVSPKGSEYEDDDMKSPTAESQPQLKVLKTTTSHTSSPADSISGSNKKKTSPAKIASDEFDEDQVPDQLPFKAGVAPVGPSLKKLNFHGKPKPSASATSSPFQSPHPLTVFSVEAPSSTKSRGLSLKMSGDELDTFGGFDDEQKTGAVLSPSSSMSRTLGGTGTMKRNSKFGTSISAANGRSSSANSDDVKQVVDNLNRDNMLLTWDCFVTVGAKGGVLGRGAFGTVKRAMRIPDGRLFAMKTLIQPSGAGAYRQSTSVMKEILAMRSLSSPYIVSFHGVIPGDDQVTLVLEYMNAGSLQDALDSKVDISEADLKRIAKMILIGLRDMHKQNIVHRDIKPANILANRSGVVKIADFGIVKELEEGKDAANTFVGTQIYMSPERISSQPYSFASDIWSLGLALVTLAQGEFPYKNHSKGGFAVLFQTITDSPVPRAENRSDEFNDFIRHFLEKDPNQRWTAEQLLNDAYLADVDLSAGHRWPWDARYHQKALATLKDVSDALADSLYKERAFGNGSEDQKVLETISESLGVVMSETQTGIMQHLPVICFKDRRPGGSAPALILSESGIGSANSSLLEVSRLSSEPVDGQFSASPVAAQPAFNVGSIRISEDNTENAEEPVRFTVVKPVAAAPMRVTPQTRKARQSF